MRQEGKPAIGIGVVTAKGANILELGKDVAAATAEFMKAVPQGINVELIADQPKVVEHAVGEFVHSFIEALAIVLFVSFVALGWRTGIVVALSVPLVLAIVFIVMNAMSLDLHRITLGALIIALGLLVDDAIIAVEMMVVKMEQGWDRVRAASFAWESTAFPMLTGTLVTAAGFLPIGFANSAVGEYAGGIFWIVAIALVASWFVAVIFTPYIGVKLLPNITVHHNHDPHAVYETRMYRVPAQRDPVVRRSPRQGGAGDRRRVRALDRRRSAMCSSSSSRCRSGPNCSCSCACRKAPRSTSPKRR